MIQSRTPTRFHAFRSLVFGIVCVLLVAFSASIQVAHAHDALGGSHSDCSLCLIAHAGITPHTPAVIPLPVKHAAAIEVLRTDAPRQLFVFSYFTRPPPAEPAFL